MGIWVCSLSGTDGDKYQKQLSGSINQYKSDLRLCHFDVCRKHGPSECKKRGDGAGSE